jgi:O-antigen ligase
MLNAAAPSLTVLEVVRLSKFALLFFYLEHNVERRNLKGIVAGVVFSILVQTSIAIVQYHSGHLLGIGRTKGAADLQYEQYTVTGFENVRRAEGTTFDSHALGLFLAMILCVPLAIALCKTIRTPYRVAAGAAFLIGIPGLVASFARAGWTAFICAAGVFAVALIVGPYRRQSRHLLRWCALAALLAGIALLPLLGKVRQRLLEAPRELVTGRIETIEMAMEMWRQSPWTGIGANNYMDTLEKHFSIFEGDPYFIPAHNMIVFDLTELGVIGVTSLIVMFAVVVHQLWRTVHMQDPLVQGLAAAVLGSMVAVQVEGLFDPIYTTGVTYYLLWFELGLGAGIARIRISGR